MPDRRFAALLLTLAVPVVAGFEAIVPGAPERQVNEHAEGFQVFPAVAAGPDGDFVVAWGEYDETPGYPFPSSAAVRARAFGSDGAARGVEFATPPGPQFGLGYGAMPRPAVAKASNGDVVLISPFGDEPYSSIVAGHRLTADGLPVGEPFEVDYSLVWRRSAVAFGQDDGFVVVWDEAGYLGISVAGRAFDADHRPRARTFLLPTPPSPLHYANLPALTRTTDGFLVVWSSDGIHSGDPFDIRARRLDDTGTPLGTDLPLASDLTHASSSFLDIASPALAPAAGGGFVAAWPRGLPPARASSAVDLRVRSFDADAVPVGPEIVPHDYVASDQNDPALAPGPDGTLVLVWESVGSPADDDFAHSVQGRLLAADAAPLGEELQLNTYTTQAQRHARIASTGPESFVIVWQSDGSTGSDHEHSSIQLRAVRVLDVVFRDAFESKGIDAWSGSGDQERTQ